MQNDDNHPKQPQAPSKSQRKREAAALRMLGKKLVGLSPNELAKLPLAPELLAEIRAAQGMRQHGAKRRQLLYIGKLLRRIDPAPISDALTAFETHRISEQRLQRRLEELCSALIEGEEGALTDFMTQHVLVDRQRLRQLVRNAVQEKNDQKPSPSRRALFRYLREIVSAE